MSGECHSIGIPIENTCHSTVILSPCPGTITGILQMWMLDIEERLVCSQLRGMLCQELTQTRYVVVMPMGTNKTISIDLLYPDGRVGLMEILLPHLSRMIIDALLLGHISTHRVDDSWPCGSLNIMIAIDEEFLSMFTVQSLVIREYLIPGISNHLQLWLQSLVGHITCYDHSIHLLAAEIFQSMNKGGGCTGITQVNVTQYTYNNVRITQRLNVHGQ